MISEIDGPDVPDVSAASRVRHRARTLATAPQSVGPGQAYQPGHASGKLRGRNWVFFDGHAEYRTAYAEPRRSMIGSPAKT